jgi:hypothetical protein
MADLDMKQKIKEVRDKFLSNNQIEDIRQNITLGVEERLKFLNSEQIKVVELLEEKHKELDIAIQAHAEKINMDQKSVETTISLNSETFDKRLDEQSLRIENQNNKIDRTNADFDKRLEQAISVAIDGQTKSTDDSFEKVSEEQEVLKSLINVSESKISKLITENNSYLKDLSDKNLNVLQELQKTLLEKFEEKDTEVQKTVTEKISIYEADKKEFWVKFNENSDDIIRNLENKIESFLKNHETVEEIIDNRLTEFRNAQKAAFEELEAALTLLEKHQDETITRFKQKSELGLTRQIHLPHSASKNRGSILHQPKDISDQTLVSVDDDLEPSSEVKPRSFSKWIIKHVIIALIATFILAIAVNYFEIDYEKNLKSFGVFLN